MPKKERVYVTPPEEPKEIEDEVGASTSEAEAPMAVPEAPEAPEIVACANCGLPKSEFPASWSRLRADLQAQNGKKLCPRCFKPVDPY